MRTLTLPVLLLVWCAAAGAQVATLGDVKAKGGAPLSAHELHDIVPGATVVSRTQAGSTRSWQNRPDGTLTAVSDGRGQSGGPAAYETGEGAWRVREDGRLCVTIRWTRSPEDWCRFVFRLDNAYYGVGTLSNESTANELEFSK